MTRLVRTLIPLGTLLCLTACASDPAPAPVLENDSEQTPVAPPPPPPETAIDGSWIVGFWAPLLTGETADAQVAAKMAEGEDVGRAAAAVFQRRMRLAADGTMAVGVSGGGKLQGSDLKWSAEQIDADSLRISPTQTDGSLLSELILRREDDTLFVEGDAFLDGPWMRIDDENPIVFDAATMFAARAAIQRQEQYAEMRESLRTSQESREKSFKNLVKAVFVVCKSEELTQDLGRTKPVQGADIKKAKLVMATQEGALMLFPIPEAPKAPLRTEHKQVAKSFDEYWLVGRWGYDPGQTDWDRLLQDTSKEMRPTVEPLIRARNLSFTIRGEMEDRVEANGFRNLSEGHYSLVRGSGSWVWLTFALDKGDPKSFEDDRIDTYPAYRVGDTLWLGHGQENGRWEMFPMKRSGR